MQRHSYRLEVRDAIASVAISASLAQTRYATCTHSFHSNENVSTRFATLFVKSNAMNEIQVVGTARNAVRLESHITVKTRFPFWAVE